MYEVLIPGIRLQMVKRQTLILTYWDFQALPNQEYMNE